jgi:hypothetical protein
MDQYYYGTMDLPSFFCLPHFDYHMRRSDGSFGVLPTLCRKPSLVVVLFLCSWFDGFVLYTFIYSIFWFRSLEASKLLMTYLLYFGYMGLICT